MTSTMPRATGKRGPQSRLPSRWVALALLASAQLMLILDVTVVNVALPDIGVALHLQGPCFPCTWPSRAKVSLAAPRSD